MGGRTLFSLLILLAVSMEACGGWGRWVCWKRKACGQWRGRVGAVRAVGAVGAVRAGGRAGAAIEHYFLFSSLLSGEYGSMWAVGERKACGQWRWGRWGRWGRVARVGAAIEHYFLFSFVL